MQTRRSVAWMAAAVAVLPRAVSRDLYRLCNGADASPEAQALLDLSRRLRHAARIVRRMPLRMTTTLRESLRRNIRDMLLM